MSLCLNLSFAKPFPTVNSHRRASSKRWTQSNTMESGISKSDSTSKSIELLSESYISYINLDIRADRRMRMERTLKEVGIKAYRTPGMLPNAARKYAGVAEQR